jgi:hypothetical protein
LKTKREIIKETLFSHQEEMEEGRTQGQSSKGRQKKPPVDKSFDVVKQ